MTDQTVHSPDEVPSNADARIGSRGGLYYTPKSKPFNDSERASKTHSRSSGDKPDECIERNGISIGFFKANGGYVVKCKNDERSKKALDRVKKEFAKSGNLKEAIRIVESDTNAL